MPDQEVRIKIKTDASEGITGINQFKSSMSGMESSTASFAATIKQHWMGISAAVYLAKQVLTEGWDLAEASAGYIENMQQLDALAKAYGTTSADIVNKTREIGDGMISMSTAAQVAVTDLTKHIDPKMIYGLAEAAVVLKDSMKTTADDALVQLSKGLEANREKSIKLAIGIIDLKDRYGEAADKMTEAEKQTAFYNLIMEKTHEIQQRVGNSTKSVADNMEAFRITVRDLKIELGMGLIRAGAGIIGFFQSLSYAGVLASAGIYKVIQAKNELQAMISTGDWKKYYQTQADNAGKTSSSEMDKAFDIANRASANFGLMNTSADEMIKAQGKASGAIDTTTKHFGHQDEKLKSLMERWAEAKITLEGVIAKDGLNDFQEKLQDISTEAEKLKERFKGLPASVKEAAFSLIDSAKEVKNNKAIEEYTKKYVDNAKTMYKDIAGLEKEYYAVAAKDIELQAKEYVKQGQNEIDVARWVKSEKEKINQEIIEGMKARFDTEYKYQKETIANTITVFENASALYDKDSSAYNRMQDMKKAAQTAELIMEAAKNATIIAGLIERMTVDTTVEATRQTNAAGTAVMNATEAVTAQASTPYAGFALAAVMAGMMAALLGAAGIAFPGGNAVSGTSTANLPKSTVLGAENGTTSESVSKTYELLKKTYDLQDNKLTEMYNQLKDLNSNITGLVASIISTGGTSADGMNIDLSGGTTQAYNNQKKFQSFMAGDWASQFQSYITVFSDKLTHYDLFNKLGNWLNNAVATPIYNALMGGKISSEITQQGFALGSSSVGALAAGGNVGVQNWANIKTTTDGGWFHGDSTSNQEVTTALTEAQSVVGRYFSETFQGIGKTIVEVAKGFGTDIEAAKAYIFDASKLDLKGMTAEEMTTAINNYVSTTMDNVGTKLFGDLIGQYQAIGEGMLDTAVRMLQEKDVVTSYLTALGQSSADTMESVLSLTDSLVNAAGSLDDLVDAWDTYYDKFYSDTEKQTNLQRILTEDLAKYNLTMPTTREGFRAILESIDKIANPQEYVDILNTASDFDKYFTTITDAAQTALDTAKEASSTALDTAKSDLQAAFEAQKTSLQTAYNAQLETLNSHLSDLTENVSKLKSASDKMKLDSVVADAITFTRSKQALMKGVYNDDILNSVSSISASTYADRASYERDYYRIKNQIGKLESDAEGKVSEAQKQIDILTNTYNAQIKAYDDQYNALLKIDKSVLSIADAISVYEAALATYNTANAADATATASTTKVVHLNNAAEMAAYNADVAAGKYYAVTLCPYKEGGDINSDLGLIGENGIEVVDFRQRYVYNNKSTQKILGNEETVAELKALRAELRAEVQDLRAEIARGNQTIRKQYNIYDDWDRRGLPTERT